MTVTEERVGAEPGAVREPGGARTVWSAIGVFVALLVVFWFSWPAGVALGLVVGVAATLRIGVQMQRSARAVPVTGSLTDDVDDDLWQEFRRLRVRLGDDWEPFSRAAVTVTRAQAASAALLQRELRLPLARAQHVLALLEREGFVGPARGTLPRQVRVAPDAAERLGMLLHA